MQRLFSTFPNSWPGVGLLILRGAAALPLLADSHWLMSIPGAAVDTVFHVCALSAAVLMAVGFCTPYAAVAAAFCQGVNIQAFGLCLALAMLGPGAWSIDARVFGRRRLKLNT